MKIKFQILSVLSSAVIIGFYNLNVQGQTPRENQSSPEVRFVAEGIKKSRQQLQCAQATITHTQVLSKDFETLEKSRAESLPLYLQPSPLNKTVKSKETSETARWYYQKPKLSMMIETSDSSSRTPTRYERLTSDGREAKLLQRVTRKSQDNDTQSNTINIGIISPPGSALFNGIWRPYSHLDPRTYMYYDGVEPLDKLLLKQNPPPVFKGEETITGSRCMKLQVQTAPDAQTLYVIDVDHGFIIRRIEDYIQSENKMVLLSSMEVPRLLESNGTWFPAIVEMKILWTAIMATGKAHNFQVPPVDDVAVPPVVKRLTISDFNANCNVPPELFTLDWPLGSRVEDKMTQKSFVVTAEKPFWETQSEEGSNRSKQSTTEKKGSKP